MDELGWLQKIPIVSLLLAAAIAAGPSLLVDDSPGAEAAFDNARAEARAFLSRNPRLEVDRLGELTLGPAWLFEMREAAEEEETGLDIQLPARMLARSQAHLDALVDDAYRARLGADSVWRLGVLDASSPPRNYIAHAFVHEMLAGAVLAVVVLLLVGAPLERTWGSLVFAPVAFASMAAVAESYRLLDASSGVPWNGAAGLAGALVGAYFIRGLGGHFVVPGIVVLPAWLGVELFVVRGFWIDDLESVPWATLCAAVGFGALAAGILRMLNIEHHLEDRAAARKGTAPHPVIMRAMRLRSDGDPYQAFDLIQVAWRENPRDESLAEAYYSIAVEVGQPEAAADAILPILRNAIRRGDVQHAIDLWLPLAAKELDVALEPTVAVRLGEALLDAGQPAEALFALKLALSGGLSSALATRVVHIARDLDEELTRRAATIALNDPALEPGIRAELEPILRVPDPEPPTAVAAGASGVPESPLERRVQAEHQPAEITAFPLDADSDLEIDRPSDDSGAVCNETALAEQALDAGALSEDALRLDGSAGSSDHSAPRESDGDVLSHWREPVASDDDPLSAVAASISDEDLDLLEAEDFEPTAEDLQLGATGPDLMGLTLDETDSDQTPMMETTDELTSPMGRGTDPGSDSSTDVFDQPTTVVATPPADATVVMAAPVATAHALRPLKALDAIPVEMDDDALEVDVDGHGKSRLPYGRIEAIALAAVDGLGPRPVLVIDFLLNWKDDVGSPLKSIRVRSDRFDPLAFEPEAANPLAALTAWITAIEQRSSAHCLPSRDVLTGGFVRCAALEAYEREVLQAEARA